MNRKFSLFSTIIFLILLFPMMELHAASSQSGEDATIFNGKHISDDNSSISLTGIKISKNENGDIFLELFFNSEINPRSFTKDTVFINGDSVIQDQKQLLFTKNSRGVKISLQKGSKAYETANKNKNFSIDVQNIETFDKTAFPAAEIKDVELNSQYNYSVKDKIWKKS